MNPRIIDDSTAKGGVKLVKNRMTVESDSKMTREELIMITSIVIISFWYYLGTVVFKRGKLKES